MRWAQSGPMIRTGSIYLPKLGRDEALAKLYVLGTLSVFNVLFCNHFVPRTAVYYLAGELCNPHIPICSGGLLGIKTTRDQRTF